MSQGRPPGVDFFRLCLVFNPTHRSLSGRARSSCSPSPWILLRLRRKKKATPLPANTPPPPVSCSLRAKAFLESSTVRYNLVLEGSIFPVALERNLKDGLLLVYSLSFWKFSL